MRARGYLHLDRLSRRAAGRSVADSPELANTYALTIKRGGGGRVLCLSRRLAAAFCTRRLLAHSAGCRRAAGVADAFRRLQRSFLPGVRSLSSRPPGCVPVAAAASPLPGLPRLLAPRITVRLFPRLRLSYAVRCYRLYCDAPTRVRALRSAALSRCRFAFITLAPSPCVSKPAVFTGCRLTLLFHAAAFFCFSGSFCRDHRSRCV